MTFIENRKLVKASLAAVVISLFAFALLIALSAAGIIVDQAFDALSLLPVLSVAAMFPPMWISALSHSLRHKRTSWVIGLVFLHIVATYLYGFEISRQSKISAHEV